MRALMIDRIFQEGGDRVTGYIPRSFRYFSKELRLSVNTITKIWRQFCKEVSINPRAKGGRCKVEQIIRRRFGTYRIDIELLKIEKPAENIFMTQFATGAQISHANSVFPYLPYYVSFVAQCSAIVIKSYILGVVLRQKFVQFDLSHGEIQCNVLPSQSETVSLIRSSLKHSLEEFESEKESCKRILDCRGMTTKVSKR